jgi:hypothetical protein
VFAHKCNGNPYPNLPCMHAALISSTHQAILCQTSTGAYETTVARIGRWLRETPNTAIGCPDSTVDSDMIQVPAEKFHFSQTGVASSLGHSPSVMPV